MLNPDIRALYSDALRPPPGYRFREAIATTYSLDLETLLTVPLHLALFSAEQPLEELLEDSVAVLEAIRRTARQVSVYAHAARLHVPRSRHSLYGLLESSVIEVLPPSRTGAFHPKLWVLRFDRDGVEVPLVRVLVLTRNLTADRCWDLKLTLEGRPTGRRVAANRPLAELVRLLPGLALRDVPEERRAQAERLADLLHRTEFETPGQFEEVRFHAVGLKPGKGWTPPPSDHLAVISPFLSERAVRELVASTHRPLALISRPESLAAIPADLLNAFECVKVLSERAEREDGEEAAPSIDGGTPNQGLHAKTFVLKRGWYTHLLVGSANATNPAMVHGSNIEIVAELVGRWKRVGTAEDILMSDNLGAILFDYSPDDGPPETDAASEEARRLLEAARRTFAEADLRLRFVHTAEGWSAEIVPPVPLRLEGVSGIRAWLVTRDEATCVCADHLTHGERVAIPAVPLELITTFVAFELRSEVETETARFVLNLEPEALPGRERDAAIVRSVLRNRAGFLRYLLLLLAGAGAQLPVAYSGPGGRRRGSTRSHTWDDLPLFEHLTLALCRDPERLRSIRDLLEDLGTEDEEVVPPEFLDLWAIFEGALAEPAR